MAPAAFLSSAASGRARIKVPSRLRDPSYFSDAAKALGQHPATRRVEANPTTGSLLLYYGGSLHDVLKYGEERQLFKLCPSPRAVLTTHGEPGPFAEGQPTVEMAALGGMTLLGLAAYQISKGKFLPAGLTMVFQALDLLRPALSGR